MKAWEQSPSEEDRLVRSRYAGLKRERPPDVPLTTDPFTAFVQQELVRVLYNRNIPQSEPDFHTDSAELYIDKCIFQNAVKRAKVFVREYAAFRQGLAAYSQRHWEVPLEQLPKKRVDNDDENDKETVLKLASLAGSTTVDLIRKALDSLDGPPTSFASLWNQWLPPGGSLNMYEGDDATALAELIELAKLYEWYKVVVDSNL
jgi:hypothetical protein